MLNSRSNLRVSLFGGAADYPDQIAKRGCLLIGFCLNKYNYILLRKNPQIFNYHTKLVYSKNEIVQNNSEIEHPVIRECLKLLDIRDGLEILCMADLPKQTGLGNSTSFCVALLNALHVYRGESINLELVGRESIEVERVRLQEPGGVQDSWWPTIGSGLCAIEIDKGMNPKLVDLGLSHSFLSEFRRRSFMYFLGGDRLSWKIAAHPKESDTYKLKLLELSYRALEEFQSENLDKIGLSLKEGWLLKRQINEGITNPLVDRLIDEFADYSLGCKLLGAGGSGFIFGILRDDKVDQFKVKYSSRLIEWDFDYEGAKIVYQ